MQFFAQISGWTRLAELYPATHRSEGQEYTQQTVQVGAVRYRKCMTVGIGSQGLYLWARPILSRYQPVLIPWGEIKGIKKRGCTGKGSSYYRSAIRRWPRSGLR